MNTKENISQAKEQPNLRRVARELATCTHKQQVINVLEALLSQIPLPSARENQ